MKREEQNSRAKNLGPFDWLLNSSAGTIPPSALVPGLVPLALVPLLPLAPAKVRPASSETAASEEAEATAVAAALGGTTEGEGAGEVTGERGRVMQRYD